MFSEKFKQLAEKVGIDLDKLINRCDELEEGFKDVDREDVNVGARWLEAISSGLTNKELSFLLISALSPSSLSNDAIEEYLVDQGFEKVDLKEVVAQQINSKYNPPAVIQTEPVEFLNQELGRNALGYNHNLESSLDAIGLSGEVLDKKVASYKAATKSEKVSVKIETLERNFTRKELSYLYQVKQKSLSRVSQKIKPLN